VALFLERGVVGFILFFGAIMEEEQWTDEL
jgi:hypothetical protein